MMYNIVVVLPYTDMILFLNHALKILVSEVYLRIISMIWKFSLFLFNQFNRYWITTMGQALL